MGRWIKRNGTFAAMVAAGFITVGSTGASLAGQAKIVNVEIRKSGDSYRVDVTLRHGDEGWDHYANAWEVLTPDGQTLGLRTLYHPHVEEQPFTRSLSGIKIPDGLSEIVVRASDSVHGWNPETVTVAVPR